MWSIIALSKSINANYTLNANILKKGRSNKRLKCNLHSGFSVYFFIQPGCKGFLSFLKDVKHGSKVKGNAKDELSHLTRSAILFVKVISLLHYIFL